MSKMDALRAMREAGHAEAMARRAKTGVAPTASRPPVGRPASVPSSPAAESPPPTDESCGHRSMNGRSCTREQGHAAKSHRYS